MSTEENKSDPSVELDNLLREFCQKHVPGIVVDWVVLANFIPNNTDGDSSGFYTFYKPNTPWINLLGLSKIWEFTLRRTYDTEWGRGGDV